MMRRRSREAGVLLLLLLAGAVLGTLVGDVLGGRVTALSVLAQGGKIGLGPARIDLYVVDLTVGLVLKINLLGAVGALVGLLIWWRR